MSNPIAASIRRKPVLWFVALVFLLSWYPTILHTLGVERASGINPLGVLVASLTVTAVLGGRTAVKELLARLVRIRVPVKWYAVAVLLPVSLAFGAVGLGILLGATQVPAAGAWGNWTDLLPAFLSQFLFVGLGEEPGWRGFMLPQLQRTYSTFVSSLIVGVVWAVWHAPFYGSQVPVDQVAPFILNVVTASVLIAWLYNNSRASVLVCMLLHAVTNAAGGGYVARVLHSRDLVHWWWAYSLLSILVVAILVWLTGPSLKGRTAA